MKTRNKKTKEPRDAMRGRQENKRTKNKVETQDFASLHGYLFFVLLFSCSIILAGCQDVTYDASQVQEALKQQQKKAADKASAMLKCQELCQDSIATRDFSPGPCLSNEIILDWVCDVAHSPRQAVDDLPANQCPAFAEGQAKHFVEVDGNCKVIKSY